MVRLIIEYWFLGLTFQYLKTFLPTQTLVEIYVVLLFFLIPTPVKSINRMCIHHASYPCWDMTKEPVDTRGYHRTTQQKRCQIADIIRNFLAVAFHFLIFVSRLKCQTIHSTSTFFLLPPSYSSVLFEGSQIVSFIQRSM